MTASLSQDNDDKSVKSFRAYRGNKDAELMARLMLQDLIENGDSRPVDALLKGILKKATPKNSLILENSGYIRIFDEQQYGFLRFDLDKNKRDKKYKTILKEQIKYFCLQSNKKLRAILLNDKGWKHNLIKQLGFTPIRYFFEMERASLEKQWYKIDFSPERLTMEAFSNELDLQDFNDCFNRVYADSFEHVPTRLKEWKDYIAQGAISGNTLFVLKNNRKAIVGFLILSHYLHDKRGHKYGFIEEIGVKNNYQGRGIGTRLLNYGVGRLQSTYNQKYVRLHVDGENRYNALDIYKKNGFVVKSTSIEYQSF
jgi:ribosomal protein S18 acetylase RimI-like enzyme